MWRKFWFLLILLTMVVCGLTVAVGDVDESISFASVFEIWSDVLQDLDQVGLRVTRVSDAREMEVGRELASHVAPRPGSPEWQDYVSQVGAAVSQFVNRRGLQYEFHIADSPAINAFALPGGQVFVTSGMLEFLESEAELAAILGHEIAHVDLRHCIERLQYVLALEQIGASELSQFAIQILHHLARVGYTQYQELEADAQAVRTSIQAGYDPAAALDVFRRMQSRFPGLPPRSPSTPVDAIAGAIIDSLGNYAHTHPPTKSRVDRIEQLVRNSRRSGQRLYRGKQNYQLRRARSEQEFSHEFAGQ